jgi:hypothetical protein
MKALVGREANSNRGFSVGVVSEDAAGEDRGDFGGAGGCRHRGGRSALSE